jgi:hypothetical protein
MNVRISQCQRLERKKYCNYKSRVDSYCAGHSKVLPIASLTSTK